MEHDSVVASLAKLASLNLATTYLALGKSSEGSTVFEESGFGGCLGPTPHPVCNFAVGLNLGPSDPARLAEIASARPQFNIYACPTDRPPDLGAQLEREGFRNAYRLRQMIARGGSAASGIVPSEVRSPSGRDETAGFMMREFFGRSDGPSRDAVRRATAAAEELELHCFDEAGETVAAAMLSRSEGMVGLYNLCVRRDRRGRGWGGAVVQWALSTASEKEWVTLQCDGVLESWYAKLGFRSIGSVEVYVWDRALELI
ncbi:MAG: GNAT family N-acetyltransferase [Chthonomonadaceae bacterium]|nr:GNAT family N-acetyltransferase [Chthonomonadaceae bacterium]